MVLSSVIVYGLAALAANAQTTADLIKAEEQERLGACLQRQQTEPMEAYEDGLQWLSEGNRPAARYCAATALIELGKYAEGASQLENLALAPDGGSAEDRAIYMTQAGNAWLIGELPEAAIVSFTDALKLNAFDPALYQDRARAYFALEKWEEGEADLDQSITMQPGDIQSYLLRGRARLNQGKLDAAMEDVVQARGIDETNIPALLLRGDVREAIRLSQGN